MKEENPCGEIALFDYNREGVTFRVFYSYTDLETGELIDVLTPYGERKKTEEERESKLRDLIGDEI